MRHVFLLVSLLILAGCTEKGPARPPPAVAETEEKEHTPEPESPPPPLAELVPARTRTGPGALDPAFGEGGVVTSNPAVTGATEEATCLILDSESLYVAGVDFSPKNAQWRIEKRRALDGTLATEFGDAGVVQSNPSARDDAPVAVAVNGEAIFIAGNDGGGIPGPVACEFEGVVKNPSWRIEKRMRSDGSVDRSFGVLGGWTGIVAQDLTCRDFALDDTSLYFLVSYINHPDVWYRFPPEDAAQQMFMDLEWRIDKRQIGSADPASGFGKRASVRCAYGSGPSELAAIVAHEGHLYVAGSEIHGTWVTEVDGKKVLKPLESRWVLERRDAVTGDLTRGFPMYTDPTVGVDHLTDMMKSGPCLFIVGRNADRTVRIEKRGLDDGSLEEGFGTSGVLTDDLGRLPGFEFGLAVHETHVYVAAYETSPGWIQKRSSETGALDTTFGDSGTERGEEGTHYRDLAVDGTHIYLVGGEKVGTSDTRWRIEKRHR